MHLMAYNITKDIIQLLWGWNLRDSNQGVRDGGAYQVSLAGRIRINNALRDARYTVPIHVSPPMRAVGEKTTTTNWKTAELKAWLLVCGPALLCGAIPSAYWAKFKLLSKLYALLFNRTIQPHDVTTIYSLARQFVREFEELYYTNAQTKLNHPDTVTRVQVCTLQSTRFSLKSEAYCPSSMIRSLIDGMLDGDRFTVVMLKPDKYRVTEPVRRLALEYPKSTSPSNNEMFQTLSYYGVSALNCDSAALGLMYLKS
ncbi:hypothetical protein BU25DRAFT_417631 [Macroventuria anomochaeta]|uniref:Uncharacterized protein n=1 Tax=Macroventuria anomochaeta TaxID=301207 RepID=A0ACB6SIY4_9PLEO|nr:uncharacterized protein BU25DRAFT_417631 [Macroventuria anomochaeta]KAF2633112.1 hypothetical protein BU25DRAFT_417631 [Macroventuria anomochaeta]